MALVLTRKAGQALTIGDNITVTVLRIEYGKVRLAIEASRETVIMRSELELVIGREEAFSAATAMRERT